MIRRHLDKGVVVTDAEKLGMVKMSEIILEYANKLINPISTKEKKIMSAVARMEYLFP